MVKTKEGYALKITGSAHEINSRVRNGERFIIRYRRKRRLVGIDWDAINS